MRYYSAVRYAIGQTRVGFEFTKGTTWTKGSGKLPEKLDEMYCKTQAITFIEKIKADLQTYSNVYDAGKLESNYQAALTLFDDDFIATGKYLCAFHGKDIAAFMTQKFEQRKISFDKDQYYRFALKTFDYTQFADLVELLAILNKL